MPLPEVSRPRDRPRWASLAADAATRPIRAWRRWGPWAAIQAAAIAAWQWQGPHAVALARHGAWSLLAALLAGAAGGAWAWMQGLRVLWPRPEPRVPAWRVGALGFGGMAGSAVLLLAALLACHIQSLLVWALAALGWWVGSDAWWSTVWGCWCALPHFSPRAVLDTLRRQAGAWAIAAGGVAACDGVLAAGWQALARTPAGWWPAAVLTLWGMTWQVGWATNLFTDATGGLDSLQPRKER